MLCIESTLDTRYYMIGRRVIQVYQQSVAVEYLIALTYVMKETLIAEFM